MENTPEKKFTYEDFAKSCQERLEELSELAEEMMNEMDDERKLYWKGMLVGLERAYDLIDVKYLVFLKLDSDVPISPIGSHLEHQ